MTCYVCGLEAGRTPLGFSVYRHPECAPGTERWAEWYMASGRKTEAGEVLLNFLRTKRGGVRK